jgi:putative Holliday junction resolvase
MRVAALDLGKVRIGLAISDELGMMAHPRPALDATSRKSTVAQLAQLAADEGIELFLVGLPLDRDGLHGPAARRAEGFALELAQVTGRKVELFDERLSTVEAGRRLREAGRSAKKSRSRIDSASACVLLQAWLDGHREGA